MSRRSATWITVGLILLVLSICVLPCVQTVRVSEGYAWSQYRIKVIGLAMENYHEAFGTLPAAVRRDKNGQPLHSWRVSLLPFLEQDSLYKQFRLDEPWDSPHNIRLAAETPSCYTPGWSNPRGTTHFQVFVGPGTAFECDGLTWDDFPKGRAHTFLVVEAAEPVPWSKPVDLHYDPNQPLPELKGPFKKSIKIWCDIPVGSRSGFNAVFADGSARFIDSRTDEKTLRGWISRTK